MSTDPISQLGADIDRIEATLSLVQQQIATMQAAITTMQAQIVALQNQPAPSPTPTPSPTPSPAPPLLTGWGGLFADSTSLDVNLDILQQRGYNCFRCMIYNADFPRTPSTASVVAAVNNAKARGMWIILDYHGYNEPFQNQTGWLSFWKNIITSVSGLYDKIVYEPCNEPVAPDVTTLASAYQAWLGQTRAMNDNHWAIVSVNNYFSGADPNLINQFPLTITDPNTLWSWHEYYMYQYHQTNWSITDAQSFADGVASQAARLRTAGKVPFMSEFGADPGDVGQGLTPPPDIVVGGSAGYAPESLAYVNELVSKLSSQNVGYMLWTADNWTDTPGAGATGALNIWGQLVGQPQPAPTPTPTPTPTPVPTGPVDQIVMTIMENNALENTQLYPALSALGFRFDGWTNNDSSCDSSQPNYVMMAFGAEQPTGTCPSDGFRKSLPAPTLLDLVGASGRSWAVIAEQRTGSYRGADHDGYILESPKPTRGQNWPIPSNSGPNGTFSDL